MDIHDRCPPYREARYRAPDALLSRDDLALRSGLSVRQIDRLLKQGREGDPHGLQGIKIGRRILVRPGELERLLDQLLGDQAEARSTPSMSERLALAGIRREPPALAVDARDGEEG